jgi:ABC-type phosphate/phosphonate transport system substrate-binding protein
MSRMNSIFYALLATLAVILLAPLASFAGPHDMVVVRPGGPLDSDEAQQNVGKLLKQIAQAAGWAPESSSAKYFNVSAKALKHIKAKKPGFIFTTPGFYLKYRKKLALVPVNKISISGSTQSSYRVVVKKGTIAALADLKGRTLAGSTLADQEFVQKIVLEGALKLDKDVTVKAMSGLSALKALNAGEVAAVVLDGQEYQSLPGLSFASEIETLYTSKPVTNTGIMAIGKNTDDASIKALLGATKDFCSTTDGKDICATFQITGFEPASKSDYKALIKAWGK